ncbi:PREDICTED: protein TMED8 isoform X3 [Chinchilla lanigera]|uniref:protein TMED8 isoform X3 n=1 Tax=Chinchilla lanigera TaxID=34839 RepID=UPI0006990088|nr:PREDICTED: protein TMED8 isoform X3 [Chinchilla lanigera]
MHAGLLATLTSDSVSMDTTVSGSIFLNLLQVLLILPSPDFEGWPPKARSNSPRVPVACLRRRQFLRPPLGRRALPAAPARLLPARGSARLLGSLLPRSPRLRLFPEPLAVGGADAPGAGCRCRVGWRPRGRTFGAPQPAEGRRAASGTAREWRGARWPSQVRKAQALAGGCRPASGPHTSARAFALCPRSRWSGPTSRPLRAQDPAARVRPLSRRRPTSTRALGALELVFCSVSKCLCSCPASFPRSAQMVVTGLFCQLQPASPRPRFSSLQEEREIILCVMRL